MKFTYTGTIEIKKRTAYIGDPVGLVNRHDFKPGVYEYRVTGKDSRVSEVRLCLKGFRVHKYDVTDRAMIDSGNCGIAFVKPCDKLSAHLIRSIDAYCSDMDSGYMDSGYMDSGYMGFFTESGYGDGTYAYGIATDKDGLGCAWYIKYI
jgi:hypothetical protein